MEALQKILNNINQKAKKFTPAGRIKLVKHIKKAVRTI